MEPGPKEEKDARSPWGTALVAHGAGGTMAETESKSELKWGSELEEGKVRRGLGRDAHL